MTNSELYFKPKEVYYIPLGGTDGKHNKTWKVEKLVFKNDEVFINLRDTASVVGIQVKQEKAKDCYIQHLIDTEKNVELFLSKMYHHPIIDMVAKHQYGWNSCHIYRSNTGCKAVIDSKLLSLLIKDKNIQSDQELYKFLHGYFITNYFEH